MKTLFLSKPYIYAAILVIAVCLFGLGLNAAFADEAPPRQVQESSESIHKNQDRIATIRKYVEEFETLKADNARLVGRMEAFGWTMDWSKNQPTKISEPSFQ